MPQAAATWAYAAVYSATVGSAAAATAAAAVAYIGTTIAVSAALAEVSKALAPTPKGLRAITTEFAGTVEPRRILYGNVRVSGMNVIPPFTTGVEGKNLQQILALAGHPVNDIGDIYFGDDLIQDAWIGAITGTDNDGLVSTGKYGDIAWVRRYDGTQTAVDYILDNQGEISTAWTSTDIGYDIPYLALTYKFKNDPYAREGKPEVSAIVEGKKVYDPRLDSTNGGSGTHRYDDDSTWEYSNNPALCLADYLMSDLGLGEDPARIDWTSVAVAANECDEVVLVPSGSSPEASNQYRYRCNIILNVTDRYEDNIEAICDTMLGHCYYTSGKWQIHAGAWSASAFDLDENDIVGQAAIKTDQPRNQKFNAVRGQYYDAQRQYLPSEFKPRTNSTYETEDGERIWREIELRGVTNEYEAQRIAIIVNRRGRNVISVTADFSLKAFKVRPYETGTMTLPEIGWDEQPVRCTQWEFQPDGTVRLTLVEESSTDWTDPAIGDYTYVAGAAEVSPSGYTPPSPTSLTATPVTNGVLLEWEIEELPAGCYFEVFREGDSSLGSPADPSILSTTYGTSFIDPTTGSGTYYYWVRAVSPSGTPGPVYPTGAGVSGTGSGVTGSGGESVKMIFKRSATQPTTPTASTTTPATWYSDVDSVPATSPYTPLWASVGTRIEASPENNWVWQTPVKFEGIDGTDGTGNTQFYVAAASVVGSDSGAATSGTVQSANTSVTPTNGTPTYTYVWTHLYTDSGNTPTCSNTAASNPYFSATVEDGTNSVSFWRVVVTDSSSPQQVAASDIRVRLTWVNTS